MPLHQTPAVVIGSIDYGESDRIVTFYTSGFGKIRGMAKGAKRSRKRFPNLLEPFTYVKLSFFEKESSSLVRIEGCDLINPWAQIREDLVKIAYASYLLELIREMVAERQKIPDVFELLIHFLSLIEAGEFNEGLLRTFEIRLLSHLGYRPNLERCAVCRQTVNEGSLGFSLRKGRVICPACREKEKGLLPLSAGTALTLINALELDLDKLSRLTFSRKALEESREILPKFISYQINKELKSLKFLDEIIKS